MSYKELRAKVSLEDFEEARKIRRELADWGFIER
jgi:hypothetical protein